MLYIAGMPEHSRKVIGSAVGYTKNIDWDMVLRESGGVSNLPAACAAGSKERRFKGGDSGESMFGGKTKTTANVLFFTTVDAAAEFAQGSMRED